MDYAQLLPSLLKTAHLAGTAIMEVYEKKVPLEVTLKADRSPVTEADHASNELICRQLELLTPGIPVISEENKTLPFEERRHWEYCWLVDPLDGTKEFLKRNGDFTVNIALVKNGRAVLGVVLAPVTGELYWAAEGEGAFFSKNKKRQVLQAAEFGQNDPGLNIVCSRSHLTAETQAVIDRYRDPNLVSRGSSLKFLMLAKGDAHVYPRIAPTMEWDTAAAQIILEEAGGQLLHFETGEPLVYNKPELLNPSFIAYGKRSD